MSDDVERITDADGDADEWVDVTKEPTTVEARGPYYDPAVVETLEGDFEITADQAEEGYVIIRGIEGEVYPCRLDIFRETYQNPEDVLDEEEYTLPYDDPRPEELVEKIHSFDQLTRDVGFVLAGAGGGGIIPTADMIEAEVRQHFDHSEANQSDFETAIETLEDAGLIERVEKKNATVYKQTEELAFYYLHNEEYGPPEEV